MVRLVFAADRRAAILAKVFEDGHARTVDLAELLQVSEVTIRGDLDELERQGRIARVHGGATMPQSPLVGFDERSTQRVEVKQRIAAAAAQLINDGTTVVLDSGTTIYALACQLPTVSHLVVVTPGVSIALRLMEVSGIEVRLLGGRVEPRIKATVGSVRAQGLEGVIAHIAFFGAGGIDADNDIAEGTFGIADSKRSLMATARRRVLLADSSKWASEDRYKVASVAEFDTVITDDGLPEQLRERVRSLGCELIIV
ncbi:DeoR family transcriptional regulator [Propionicimonas paludicola]|uniref:DeoR family transcriptional regulator n=1 Tax=Propionicimonas paludicola TaxID=185243 RepID=A0A2A9CMD6_9ACTN|nr:DeoR family transcriptional regulator [Propionicimonas paludicola]